MRIFKSDGRYNYHRMGYHYIAQFRWASIEESRQYAKIVESLEVSYGPYIEHYVDEGGLPRRRRNENYILEVKHEAKRRRIYAKDEKIFTMALLMI